MQKPPSENTDKSAKNEDLQTWSKPTLQSYSIATITKFGFETNCDGGIAPDVIDGQVFGCPP